MIISLQRYNKKMTYARTYATFFDFLTRSAGIGHEAALLELGAKKTPMHLCTGVQTP